MDLDRVADREGARRQGRGRRSDGADADRRAQLRDPQAHHDSPCRFLAPDACTPIARRRISAAANRARLRGHGNRWRVPRRRPACARRGRGQGRPRCRTRHGRRRGALCRGRRERASVGGVGRLAGSSGASRPLSMAGDLARRRRLPRGGGGRDGAAARGVAAPGLSRISRRSCSSSAPPLAGVLTARLADASIWLTRSETMTVLVARACASAVLALVAALLVAFVLDVRGARRRARGPAWWRALGAPLTARPAVDWALDGFWSFIHGRHAPHATGSRRSRTPPCRAPRREPHATRLP